MQEFLYIHKRHPGTLYTPRSLNAGKLLKLVFVDHMGPGFTAIDLRPHLNWSEQQHPKPVTLVLRDDLLQVVQDLISGCPPTDFAKHAKPLFNCSERIYNEFWTGQKWEREQQRSGSKYPIVSLVLWSDKVVYDGMGRCKGHPLTLSIAEFLLHCSICW